MKENYKGYEVRYPVTRPTETGAYFGKTPIFEQALGAARKIGGSLYGITADGKRVLIFY